MLVCKYKQLFNKQNEIKIKTLCVTRTFEGVINSVFLSVKDFTAEVLKFSAKICVNLSHCSKRNSGFFAW